MWVRLLNIEGVNRVMFKKFKYLLNKLGRKLSMNYVKEVRYNYKRYIVAGCLKGEN